VIVARAEVFRREIAKRDWDALRLASELRVSPPTAERLLDGGSVAAETVSRALRVFAPMGFHRLFAAVDERQEATPR